MKQKNPMRVYLGNYPLYFKSRKLAKKQHDFKNMTLKGKLVFRLVWLDVFINMLTGGDPRETLSSSFHKDRKSSWGAGLLINIVETLSTDDHGEKANQPNVGEGSADNRELQGLGRIVVSFWWVLILSAIFNIAMYI